MKQLGIKHTCIICGNPIGVYAFLDNGVYVCPNCAICDMINQRSQLQQQVSDLTRENKVLERALELALDYFALIDNKIHLTKSHELCGIFLHDDFSKAKWIAKAMEEK